MEKWTKQDNDRIDENKKKVALELSLRVLKEFVSWKFTQFFFQAEIVNAICEKQLDFVLLCAWQRWTILILCYVGRMVVIMELHWGFWTRLRTQREQVPNSFLNAIEIPKFNTLLAARLYLPG